ncbi:galanin receptor 2b-like [Lytechinus pictus]|uniref:galanin receptor 2b-like n=1 Tax=Lytechinus pictus TaxID=7653 RepID=UPI0030BA1BC6
MNVTSEPPPLTDPGSSRLVAVTIYSILGSVGIIGNGLVLVVMIAVKDLRNITNLFIANQSIIDMTTSIFLFITFIAPHPAVPKQKLAANFICSFWNSGYIFWGTIISSTYNLVMLALERYFAVMYPVAYRNKFSYRRAAGVAVAPWIVGFGFGIHWMVVNQHVDGRCIVKYESNFIRGFIGCLTVIVEFVIPLIIIAYVYIRIGKLMRQRVEDVGNPSTENRSDVTTAEPGLPNYREKARKNVIKTLLIVCITYVICWTPNQIVFLYYNLGGPIDLNGPVFYASVYIAFVNMCINPVIYTFKYRKFQKGLKKVFRIKA